MTQQSQVFSFHQDSSASLDSLESLLRARLPYSLPALRRIQYARYKGATTEHARVIFVSPQEAAACATSGTEMIKFTAAYVDVSHGPETQMWLFSTLETETEEQDESVDEVLYRSQLDLVVSSVSHLAESYGGRLAHRDAVLLGTLHSRVRRLLGETVTPRKTGLYDKWIFKAEGLSEASGDLEEGMSWDVARERDLEIAISRTHIPRTVDTLRNLSSVVIRLPDGEPAAWSFLGLDGSLSSLHCEPPYRGRGFAKRLAARLMRQGSEAFSAGDGDGWLSADVEPGNEASRRVCRSLGGVPRWEVSWVLLHLSLANR